MKHDLGSLSSKELEKLHEDVKKALANARNRDRREARKAAEKAAAEFGFSLDDLSQKSAGAPRRGGKKSPSAPRFANPDDPSQTWTGRGRQPRWFKEAVARGVDPEKLAV